LVLRGKVALVTGAASGIGAATAGLLAAQGASVWCADKDDAGAARVAASLEAGGDHHSAGLDVSGEAEWEALMAALSGATGRLDILVHAAGISAAAPIGETSLADWHAVLAVNLDGTFLAIREGIRAMRAAGGAVVVLGSASGIRPASGAAAYSTSKAGVGMLVRSAARECRDAGLPIRINAVSPAGVKTPMWRSMPFFQDLIRQHGSEEAAYAAMAGGGPPFAEAREVAECVLFLVSDAARHITGVELPVDGGYLL
jgi:NAD(P)-dependent dehydrogenase (short-subunit alcohol dehydrogenase family)